ncbi:MAG: hypothetical protein LAP40_06795 [Acidobacteriia bacterium]|nr:hypothetical protein [Terriglobia bacterium]
MQVKSLTKTVCLLTAATMSSGTLLAAQPAVPLCACVSDAPDWNFPSEASRLLKEIRSAAFRLTDNAANLKSYGPGGVSWHGHAGELTLIREQINAVGKRIQRLHTIRHATAPWQQEAIDSMTPMAATLASRTEAAIRYLQDNRTYLWSETYRDHVQTLSSRADQMKKSVSLHLELAETLDKLEALRDRTASIGS